MIPKVTEPPTTNAAANALRVQFDAIYTEAYQMALARVENIKARAPYKYWPSKMTMADEARLKRGFIRIHTLVIGQNLKRLRELDAAIAAADPAWETHIFSDFFAVPAEWRP